ncbi:hypothetical protein [Nocardia sp. NBC_01388]|uniref:hypothetical protein n=1 Tax=Nocardia sp. NBC_01388 TaxID=2903596 RepID=UPI00324B8B3B
MDDRDSRRSLKDVVFAPFPLPDRADTFSRPLHPRDQVVLARRRAFGTRQTLAATQAWSGISDLVARGTPLTAREWIEVYEWLTRWRYEEARAHTARNLGTGTSWDPLLTITPITGGLPNHDILGDAGWLRAGAQWSEAEQRWNGGTETPASRITQAARAWALPRFTDPGTDTLQNMVTLPGGAQVKGNLLVRGAAMAQRGRERVARRGGDTPKFHADLSNLIAVTGADADREIVFKAAMAHLASQEPGTGEPRAVTAWAECTYFLYQGPQMKRGSDAVIRIFAALAGAYLFGRAPVIDHDIDLKAYATGQDWFVEHIRRRQDQAPGKRPAAVRTGRAAAAVAESGVSAAGDRRPDRRAGATIVRAQR